MADDDGLPRKDRREPEQGADRLSLFRALFPGLLLSLLPLWGWSAWGADHAQLCDPAKADFVNDANFCGDLAALRDIAGIAALALHTFAAILSAARLSRRARQRRARP